MFGVRLHIIKMVLTYLLNSTFRPRGEIH